MEEYYSSAQSYQRGYNYTMRRLIDGADSEVLVENMTSVSEPFMNGVYEAVKQFSAGNQDFYVG